MGISSLPAGPIWVAAMTAAAVLALWGAIPAGRGRPVRITVLMRALLPVRILRSRSGQLDLASFLFSKMLAGTAIGWALISANWWSVIAERATASLLALPVRTSPLAAELLMTVALFVAYEGVYWLNHWLSHRIGWLWAFHKVHHTAESLSLLTNFRVHPVDTIVFYNMAAAVEGVTAGVLIS
jgi:sterol desaturase/sphingolipid hydroxylase (fatty acid hydroxylase superfamily)